MTSSNPSWLKELRSHQKKPPDSIRSDILCQKTLGPLEIKDHVKQLSRGYTIVQAKAPPGPSQAAQSSHQDQPLDHTSTTIWFCKEDCAFKGADCRLKIWIAKIQSPQRAMFVPKPKRPQYPCHWTTEITLTIIYVPVAARLLANWFWAGCFEYYMVSEHAIYLRRIGFAIKQGACNTTCGLISSLS